MSGPSRIRKPGLLPCACLRCRPWGHSPHFSDGPERGGGLPRSHRKLTSESRHSPASPRPSLGLSAGAAALLMPVPGLGWWIRFLTSWGVGRVGAGEKASSGSSHGWGGDRPTPCPPPARQLEWQAVQAGGPAAGGDPTRGRRWALVLGAPPLSALWDPQSFQAEILGESSAHSPGNVPTEWPSTWKEDPGRDREPGLSFSSWIGG